MNLMLFTLASWIQLAGIALGVIGAIAGTFAAGRKWGVVLEALASILGKFIPVLHDWAVDNQRQEVRDLNSRVSTLDPAKQVTIVRRFEPEKKMKPSPYSPSVEDDTYL